MFSVFSWVFLELEESSLPSEHQEVPLNQPKQPLWAPMGRCQKLDDRLADLVTPSTALGDQETVPGQAHHPVFTCHSNQGEVNSQLVLPVPGTSPNLSSPCPVGLSIFSLSLPDPLRETSLLLLLSGNSFLCKSGQWREDWLCLFLIKLIIQALDTWKRRNVRRVTRDHPH